ncbi:MAG: glycosyltransferase family 2 protein [Patescibacteria group bacterium]|nr:glycosyltransferase family 2 protein [Patescibacteria group bacterium]
MYHGQKISLILPTYNEKDSIKKVIGDFERLGVVDEILVINNNAAAGTTEEVKQTTAREIPEPVQGYGQAIRRGLAEASGDLIVVCEPDDTFLAADLFKFLVFSEEVDVVYGSRTIRNYIWEGANMGRFLRWGNWFVAKMIEVLFNTNYLSDVGCTFRLIKRTALEKISPYLMVKSNFFGPEMMIRGYLLRLKCVQIPINYKDRVGKSSVTGDLKKAFTLGMKMICLIIAMRLGIENALIRYLDHHAEK